MALFYSIFVYHKYAERCIAEMIYTRLTIIIALCIQFDITRNQKIAFVSICSRCLSLSLSVSHLSFFSFYAIDCQTKSRSNTFVIQLFILVSWNADFSFFLSFFFLFIFYFCSRRLSIKCCDSRLARHKVIFELIHCIYTNCFMIAFNLLIHCEK